MSQGCKKIWAGKYEYTDSKGKRWLLENKGYYFQWGTTMWSAYGEVLNAETKTWNGADLVLSDTKKRLIQRIESKVERENIAQ